MEKKFEFDEIKTNVWNAVRSAVDTTVQKTKEAAQWIGDNPEMALAIAGGAATLLKSTQSLVVNRRVRLERNRIDHTYYDPSTGMHWDLKRKATNADRAEILRRKALGQDAYTILKQMNLIK